jgi:hypothetical protein
MIHTHAILAEEIENAFSNLKINIHDTQHNNTQHNDIQHNNTQHNDIQHNET